MKNILKSDTQSRILTRLIMGILNKKKCLPHLQIAKVEEARKVMKESNFDLCTSFIKEMSI
jgi:hypothetical protein